MLRLLSCPGQRELGHKIVLGLTAHHSNHCTRSACRNIQSHTLNIVQSPGGLRLVVLVSPLGNPAVRWPKHNRTTWLLDADRELEPILQISSWRICPDQGDGEGASGIGRELSIECITILFRRQEFSVEPALFQNRTECPNPWKQFDALPIGNRPLSMILPRFPGVPFEINHSPPAIS